MIQHIVLFAPKADHDPAELSAVMDGLAGLIGKIPGFTAFSHGPNRDFEMKSRDYPYGFICTFADQTALETYAADPRHQALGGRLVALTTGGADGIMVIDLEVPG